LAKRISQIGLVTLLLATGISSCLSQTSSELQTFLVQKIGLKQDQIAAIQNGQPFAKSMEPRSPAEIFVFGVIYINAAPESFVQFTSDYDRLSHIPGYLAIRKFSTPPQLSDPEGFGFSSDDVKGLKDCKPQNCVVQLPATAMETLQRAVREL